MTSSRLVSARTGPPRLGHLGGTARAALSLLALTLALAAPPASALEQQVVGADTRSVAGAPYGAVNQSRTWYNRRHERWDAVLPYTAAGGGSRFNAHVIVRGVNHARPRFSDLIVASDASARPDVAYDALNQTLSVLVSDSAFSRYSRYRYIAFYDRYLLEFEAEVPGIAHLPEGKGIGARSAATLHIEPNGSVWAAVLADRGLVVQYSSDGGKHWLPEALVVNADAVEGATAWVSFKRNKRRRVGLFAAEAARGGGPGEFHYWTIDADLPGGKFRHWRDRSKRIPDLGAAGADAVVSAASDAFGRQYFAVETAGAAPGEPLIALFRRTPNGAFKTFQVQAFATGGQTYARLTRPSIRIDNGRRLLFLFAHESAPGVAAHPTAGYLVAQPLDHLDRFAAEPVYIDVFRGSERGFGEVLLPRGPIRETQGLLGLAHSSEDDSIWRTLAFRSGKLRKTPRLVRLDESSAIDLVEGAGFRVGGASGIEDNSVADGTVLSQSPGAGAPIEPGAAIDIAFAFNSREVPVPALVGRREDQAREDLVHAGLTVGGVTLAKANSRAGTVVAQSPAPPGGTIPGGEVALTLSAGPGASVVPALTRMDEKSASERLAGLGLKIGVVNRVDDESRPAGIVLSQGGSLDDVLPAGSTVQVVVSRGPRVVIEIPDVVGLEEDAAEQRLRQLGFLRGRVIRQGDPAPVGTVIGQTPGPRGPWRFADRFDEGGFGNSDGTLAWSGPWIENDDHAMGPLYGNVKVRSRDLNLGDSPDTGGKPSAVRALNLEGAEGARLSFSYSFTPPVEPWDLGVVEFSTNGGRRFTPIALFGLERGSPPGDYSFDLAEVAPGFDISDAQLRFRVVANFSSPFDQMRISNVEVEVTGDAPKALEPRIGVDLVVSSGSGGDVEVPLVEDLDEAGAQAALEAFGFVVEFARVRDPDAPAGFIFDSIPSAGDRAPFGSTVSVIIARGRSSPFEFAPNLIGLTIDEARRALERRSSPIGTIEEIPSATVPAGLIIDQDPRRGFRLGGAAVNVTVSSGP